MVLGHLGSEMAVAVRGVRRERRQGVGTRAWSSSNQFWTTMSCTSPANGSSASTVTPDLPPFVVPVATRERSSWLAHRLALV